MMTASARGCVQTRDLIFVRGNFGGDESARFVQRRDRAQFMLLLECLDDLGREGNPVRVGLRAHAAVQPLRKPISKSPQRLSGLFIHTSDAAPSGPLPKLAFKSGRNSILT